MNVQLDCVRMGSVFSILPSLVSSVLQREIVKLVRMVQNVNLENVQEFPRNVTMILQKLLINVSYKSASDAQKMENVHLKLVAEGNV